MQIFIITTCVLHTAVAAKILADFPTPSISHQASFRVITQELARRGYDITIITPDPAFEKGKTPPNLREIDVHDISYNIWMPRIMTMPMGKKENLKAIYQLAVELLLEIFVEQLKTHEVQSIMKSETFDLLLLEAWVRPALFFTHLYEVPTIIMSSFGGYFDNYEQIGAASHPLLYPKTSAQKLNNRSMWDKINELYNYWYLDSYFKSREIIENRELRRFAPDMPDLRELSKNVDMLFLNMHPLWDGNRPVPPSVIYMNGIQHKPSNELPEDLETYLNSSKNGVVYVSFGTNVIPSKLPAETIQSLINVFSQLPYEFLWKWDNDELPGRTENIKIFKWLPQSNLLRHPNIKLFITQCGLQSTDESITAGVPLLGLPMLGDQWYNAERYQQLGIGVWVDIETLNEEELKEAINKVINDDSYRQNVSKLRSLMSDQPQPALDRVIWWTEHVLYHGGGKHLRASAANMTWRQYLELDLVLIVLVMAFVTTLVLILVVRAIVYTGNYMRHVKVKYS